MRESFRWHTAVLIVGSSLLVGSISVRAQQPTQSAAISKPISSAPARSNDSSRGPKFTEYKGVRIGMSADEARHKLGKAKDKDKTQDLYVSQTTKLPKFSMTTSNRSMQSRSTIQARVLLPRQQTFSVRRSRPKRTVRSTRCSSTPTRDIGCHTTVPPAIRPE